MSANGKKKTARKKTTRKKKRKPGPNGRPTKLTKEFAVGFIAIIAKGNYRCTAAASMGIDDSTARLWMRKGEADLEAGKNTMASRFSMAVTRAESQAELGSVDSLRAAAEPHERTIEVVERELDANGKVIKEKVKRQTIVERGDPKAAIEFLQRKFPEKWGRKDKIDQTVEHVGDQEHTIRLVQEGHDRLSKRFDHRQISLS